MCCTLNTKLKNEHKSVQVNDGRRKSTEKKLESHLTDSTLKKLEIIKKKFETSSPWTWKPSS
ncbi:CLUMA_CG000806, isoform A [Clunio marinus]|uniref:CLUMA_CG000806, isoform A n=1 Tax=Clunio marinus TaxID=568069 RepID=A0A1J1HL80_9DIPT|nr:CLUMA_CG000806, isoform A [Clunio marinus]